MIFSELYSVYFNTVAQVISRIIDGERDPKMLQRTVMENGFEESAMTIIPALKSQRWPLVTGDGDTPLRHKPTMPLTTLEKRWLKAISMDPRIKLFGLEFPDLSDTDPLFTTEDYCVYDKYLDADPFESEEYILTFRTVLTAIKEKKQIKFLMDNQRGGQSYVRCIPERLEYSEKDDKFRIITIGNRFVSTVNLSRMHDCSLYNGEHQLFSVSVREPSYASVTIKITDERNALERVMMHFAHFEKRAERLDKKTYLLTVKYDKSDEMEMVIRILSFGPMVRVIEPESFVRLIRARLERQMRLGLR